MKLNFGRKKANRTCPKCGVKFFCTTKEGCWCEKIFVSREKLSEIRKDYMDCLCEKCLKSYSFSEN